MAIGMPYLRAIERAGAFPKDGGTVLDIGASHLQFTTLDDILYFFEKYPKRPLDDRLRAIARELTERAVWAHPRGQTFLAEVLEHTSIRYVSLDIFPGPSTRVFDLNFDPVPEDLAGRVDVVLNFGTTEHVFGQYNAFKVIHDALKPGGYAFHQVPTTGWFNHGYFKYHPRVFAELASANGYEVADLYVSEPQGHWSLEEHYTPLDCLPDPKRFREAVKTLGGSSPVHPNGLINAFLRKAGTAPFRLALERATAPGGITDPAILRRYGPANPKETEWFTLVPPPPRPVRKPLSMVKWMLRKCGVKRAMQVMGLR
jgi:SAM-dependent methyltransferase